MSEFILAQSLRADPTIIATAVVTVISALVIGVVTVINAIAAAQERKDSRVARQALSVTSIATEKKVDTVIEKAVEIHTLTNSNLSKVTESLNVALEKIAGMEKLVASMVEAKKVADILALPPASAPLVVVGETRAGVAGVTADIVSDVATGVLKSIDKNTAAIEENTKKTTDDVEALKAKTSQTTADVKTLTDKT